MIKNFKPRLYQETILGTCAYHNTLVILPTGMGKTAIAMMLAVQRLKQYPNSKILFLAPTKPLVEQHLTTFANGLEIELEKLAVFTGFIKPEKREELWKKAQIIFSTPQGLENDIINERVNLKEVSLLIFDEAHRAVGDYAYNFVAKQYNKRADFPRILGLTASPGSDMEKISEICKNLYIEEMEVRTEQDPDVKPYIQDVKITWIKVELPKSFNHIQKHIKDCYRSKLKSMSKLGYLSSFHTNSMSKTDLLKLQAGLHGQISKGDKSFEILKSVSLAAEALKVQHALELLESQGITPLYLYLEKLQEESAKTKTKALKNLVKDLNFRSALIKTRQMYEAGVEHPKLPELKKIIEEEVKDQGVKIIIFNQFRDTASKLEKELNEIRGVNAKIFVGQAKRGMTGLSQKKQKEILDEFRNNEFNTLIATSVAEEGIDIPKVDVVIFYEPIPSAIRHIQRRGRTGRLEKGKVIVLMTKNTRDEGYKWSAHHKEKRMYRTIEELKKKMNGFELKNEQTLEKFIPESNVKIFADDREKSSGVIKELVDLGIKINLKRLNMGDYILSSRVGVEYKTVQDFVDSIIDGRLLEQLKDLKQNFERPLIIIEGIDDIYSQRKIHPNAIRGMLANITISYGIPVLYSKNFKDTAAILAVIAKREQDDRFKDIPLHFKKPLSLKAQQEYIVSSLPGIGTSLAKPLLKEFGSVKRVVNADEDRLKKVEKIGEKKAKEIRKVLDEDYKF